MATSGSLPNIFSLTASSIAISDDGASGFGYTPDNLYLSDGSTIITQTWSNVLQKILNLSAVKENLLPNELIVENTIGIVNNDTTPTETILLEAGINGGVGTFFGVDYNSNTNQDFVIQTTNTNSGGVLFKQYGAGSTTTQTKIKQGVITCNNTANTNSIVIDASNNNIVITDGTTTNTINEFGISGGANSATTAGRATNIAGGAGGSIPYQTAVNTTALLANGTAGLFLKSQGTTLPPVWDTPAGGGSNATTIDTTDTNTAGTYYPTFVSGTGASQILRTDTTPTQLTYNPSTNQLGVNAIRSNTANALTLNGTSGSVNFQSNGTTKVSIDADGLELDDGASHTSTFNSTWFSTASANNTNIYQSSAGINKSLNIGGFSSGGNTTKYPYGTISKYSTQEYLYTSGTDTTPLQITGTDTSKTLQLANSSTASTLTLKSVYSNSGNYDAELKLMSSTSGNNAVNLECRDSVGDYSTLNMKSGNINLYTGIPAGEGMGQSGIQLTNTTDTYYADDTYSTGNFYIARINNTGWKWGSSSQVGQYPNPPLTNMGLINSGNGFMALDIAGVLSFGANNNGIQNRITPTTLSLGTSTTLNGANLTFRNFDAYYTGGALTITTWVFTNCPTNCDYYIAVQNAGSGTLTFNNTAGARFVGGLNFSVIVGKYATIRVQRLLFNGAIQNLLTGTLYN